MTILRSLDDSPVVRSYVVHEFRQWSKGSFHRIAVFLTNGTILHIKEYAAKSERLYSFHWQQSDSKLIMRWDNAPHHTQISTFPHHVHKEGEIFPSTAVGISDVLLEIEQQLKNQT